MSGRLVNSQADGEAGMAASILALTLALAVASGEKPTTYKLAGETSGTVYPNIQRCEHARRLALKKLHARARKARASRSNNMGWVIIPSCLIWR